MTRQFQKLALLALSFTVMGCQRLCQPLTEIQTSFIDLEWRLIETNDPNLAGQVSNVNFQIVKWGNTYEGTVERVLNNVRYNTPVLMHRYNVDPEQRLLRMQFYAVATGQNGEVTFGAAQGSPITYRYQLNRELKLTNEANNFYYRYIPFTVVTRPDDKCTFTP